MDQLKEFLGMLRRQHFWIVAPLLLIIGLVGWMKANKQLSDEFDQNKQKVQSYISQMQSVSSHQPHPNDDFHNGMEQLIAQRRENVRKAWERKWERQKQELKWPADLPADFISQVEQMRPIEKVGDKRDIPSGLRRTYGSFIKEVLPRLAARIGAKWEPSTAGRGFAAEGFGEASSRRPPSEARAEGDATAEQPTLVQWDPENQALLEKRFDWGSYAPTTLEVLYAQEDLWVLTTLIEIVERTNGNAMIRSQAAVKAIDFIQIGKDVDPPSRQGFSVVRPQPLGDADAGAETTPAAGEEPPLEPPPEGTEPPLEPGGDFVEGQAAPDIKLDLVKNRYYDENYVPIADLPTLMSSVTVAKRIPVRMRLLMDQRQISKLLAECANAPLTFEVRQLRFNPQGVGRGGAGGEGVTTEGTFFSPQRNIKTLADYQSLDRTVELFGIVYIFNPVDEAVLGGQAPSETSPSDDSTASQPADRRSRGGVIGQQLASLGPAKK